VVVRGGSLEVGGNPGRDVTGAALAISNSGRTLAAWLEEHGNWVAMVSERQGTEWAPAVRVQDVPTGYYATRGRGVGIPPGPWLTTDSAAHAWLLWDRAPAVSYPQGRTHTLMASDSPPGGGWTPEKEVGVMRTVPALVGQAAGDALVAWNDDTIRCTRLSPSQRWRSQIVAQTSLTFFGPSAEALPGGGALVSWAERAWPQASPPAQGLSIARVSAEPAVTGTAKIALQGMREPVMAVCADGTAFAAWATEDAIWARQAPRWTDPYEPALAVGTGLQAPDALRLRCDSAGNAMLVWLEDQRLAAALKASGRDWSEARTLVTLRPLQAVGDLQVALDPVGNAFVVYSMEVDGTVEIRGVRYRVP
jgi:hypothetical protein